MRPAWKAAYPITKLLLLLAALASGWGLLWPDLYRDPEPIRMAWRGNDLVTLVVVVPLLALTLWRWWHHSQKAELVWMGLTAYLCYNYAFYLFGAAFNKAFLLYVSIWVLSVYTLILGLSAMDTASLRSRLVFGRVHQWVSLFLALVALVLFLAEGRMILGFLLWNKPPEAPPLVLALDFSLIIPNMVLASVLLWNKKTWGFILAVLMMVKGVTYGLGLLLGTWFITRSGGPGAQDPLLPFYSLVCTGSLVGVMSLLHRLKKKSSSFPMHATSE